MSQRERAVVLSKKYLFAASTGGHLAELVRLSERYDASSQSVWLTFDTDQSRSLLAGKRVVYMPYIRPRDVGGVLRGSLLTRKLIAEESFDCAVSTGAAIALSVLPQTKLAGIRSVYIESVSRLDGPSLSGRLVALARTAELYTQHPTWGGNRWKPIPSVLSSFESVEVEPATTLPKLFVTLGTIEGYRFDRLVDAVLSSGVADDKTIWQLGDTMRGGLPGTVYEHMPADAFEDAVTQSDVVITHAGVGTILQALELGKYPVVVPRSGDRKEHVDNHQFQIADKVRQMGVGSVLRPEEIDRRSVLAATRRYVRLADATTVNSGSTK